MSLKLNEDTMLYDIDTTFDLNAWKDDVEGKRSNANFSIAEVAETLAGGPKKIGQIHTDLGGEGIGSHRSLKRILQKGKTEGYFRSGKDGYKLTKKGSNLNT